MGDDTTTETTETETETTETTTEDAKLVELRGSVSFENYLRAALSGHGVV